ncbi:hypothetical protein [Thermogymnomonas acidicola]|uniref:hypothetical protein n=1 Tax=Thermogymnomonas acidicola TaxID=399579 RepID=UPI0014940579|nr:hypothetical protein [Thermogymnomonas acidicola]
MYTTRWQWIEDVVSLEQARMKRIEIHYRGIFQKTLAKRIGGDLVKIAVSQGKVAFSNGRYSDSPERTVYLPSTSSTCPTSCQRRTLRQCVVRSWRLTRSTSP